MLHCSRDTKKEKEKMYRGIGDMVLNQCFSMHPIDAQNLSLLQ
jgi:hypothetical protein